MPWSKSFVAHQMRANESVCIRRIPKTKTNIRMLDETINVPVEVEKNLNNVMENKYNFQREIRETFPETKEESIILKLY